MPHFIKSGPAGAEIVCRVEELAGIVQLTLTGPKGSITLSLAPEEALRLGEAIVERALTALGDLSEDQAGGE